MTKTVNQPELVRVTEAAARPQSVDAAAGVIRGVKLLGFESKNGRLYPPTVIRSSVHLYEGAKVNINHPASGDPATPRQYEDRIGVIRAARIQEGAGGGIYGDFHYNPKHRIAEQLAWDAANNPEALGFSHNALLRFGGQQSGKRVVESIVSVKSVDLVADPATTRSLFESEEPMEPTATLASASSDPLEMVIDSIAAKISEIAKSDGDSKAKAKEIADLLKKQDKIMALLGEEKPKDEGGAPAEEQVRLRSEVALLTEQLNTFKVKEKQVAHQQAIEQELAAAGLDKTNPNHVSELFGKTLLATESKDDRAALIADRVALLGVRGGAAPVKPKSTPAQTTEGMGGWQPPKDAADLARRLKSFSR